LGFNNKLNFDKSQWMEEKYKKDIFKQSEQEAQLLVRIIEFELGKDLQ
jgi:hypothetical protein